MIRPLISLSLVILCSSAFALDVVVPNSLTNTEGNNGNVIPFGATLFCTTGIRHQQVYNDAEIPDGYLISAIRYRQDTSTIESNDFPLTTYPVSISMSTTTANSMSLSDTFADNHGPDEVVVFSGNLEISSPVTAQSPAPFDIEIPITPFAYHGGNLLVDLTFQACAQPITGFTFFDSDLTGGSPMWRVYSGDKDSPTAKQDSGSTGLVTQFSLSPIPTSPIPTMPKWSLALLTLLLGLTGFAYYHHRKVVAS